MEQTFLNWLVEKGLGVLTFLIIIKVCLMFWDDSKGLTEWQRPLCRIHYSEQLNCQEYLPTNPSRQKTRQSKLSNETRWNVACEPKFS